MRFEELHIPAKVLEGIRAAGFTECTPVQALTLPEADEAWLAEFSEGFLGLARRYDVDLVGGDTTQGPLSVTVQVMGLVPRGQALRRAGAGP